MRYLYCFFSNIVILLKQLGGCRIHYSFKSLLSPLASFRTHKNGKIKLGKKTMIRSFTEVTANGGEINIGNNCFINRGCMVVAHENIIIGDNTTIGPGVYIYDHDHSENGGYKTDRIVIGKNVWIGANCTILKGVHIGDNVTVAAGCTVTHDIMADMQLYQKKYDILLKKGNEIK